MLYVIIVAAIVIFWLVAIDRPVLKVSFKEGHIHSVKGNLPPSFRHNLVEMVQSWCSINKCQRKSNKEFVTYFHIKDLSLAKVRNTPNKHINCNNH